MSAAYDTSDSYNTLYTASPEGVNITSQPQPQPPRPYNGSPGCPHSKRVPCSTVTHEGGGHQTSGPLMDCSQCGHDVASILLTQLGLGASDIQSLSPLQFRDVMVLTQDKAPSDVSGLVQGLRDSTQPVRVVGEEEADVLINLSDVNEVLVVWRGLLQTGAVRRRVLVVLQPEASGPTSPPVDGLQTVLSEAEHIIWVLQPRDNGAKTDDVALDMEDRILRENRFRQHEESPMLKEHAHKVNTVINSPYHPNHVQARNTNAGYSTSRSTTFNDCCDNFCLGCCIDAGETGTILCCPCCGELGNWCESCCRGFGEGLNSCIQAACCDCSCCSSGGHGSGCGDCDCGDCNCDCGDCNCDCGSCDCVIM